MWHLFSSLLFFFALYYKNWKTQNKILRYAYSLVCRCSSCTGRKEHHTGISFQQYIYNCILCRTIFQSVIWQIIKYYKDSDCSGGGGLFREAKTSLVLQSILLLTKLNIRCKNFIWQSPYPPVPHTPQKVKTSAHVAWIQAKEPSL